MKTQFRSILQVGIIQDLANETNRGKNRQNKVKPADVSTEPAKNQATKPPPDDNNDEREVEETLKLPDSPNLGALGVNRDMADEDILEIGPSKSAQHVIVSDSKPFKRRVIREGNKERANNTTTIGFGPEAQLASKWLNSAQVKQLEEDTGMCRIL